MAVDASTRFLMARFSKHYRMSSLFVPDRFSKREFGFMFYDRDFVIRHLGFPTRAALKNYLIEQAPAHAYYSCAYYEKPDAPTMAEKHWLGADLIFDLDADHVEGTKGLPYHEMLERVKQEVKRLLDEFIMGDLGFGGEELRIAFSGGRGYHIHVTSPRVLRLTSHERREIVDYVTGTGLDMDWVFPPTPFETGRFGPRIDTAQKRSMPRAEDGGWRARIRKGIERLLKDLDGLDRDHGLARLRALASEAKIEIGRKTLEGMYDDLFSGERGRRGADRMLSEDVFEVFSEKRHLDSFISLVDFLVKGRMKGETDEPVTSDIKRLIRLPSSLHGKTGFEVVLLTRDELDGFDPFRDAVSEAFGDEEVEVVCQEPVNVRLRGERFALKEGANAVPEYVAVHLLCRRQATLGGP
ncbi:MAG: DNA primase catalytic subunit PriS [Thermoplasmata archaeon]